MNETFSWDLVHRPWVRVMTPAGVVEELGLLELFERAAEVDLDWSYPLETVAVLRQVLLPVYWRACGLPTDTHDWGERFTAGLDVDAIREYLDRQAERFDLFHPRWPFAQVAGLRTAKGNLGPSSLLVASVATGNNTPLFTERTEADPPTLSPAQAARALVATLGWDTAAIKSGAVGDSQAKAGKTTGNPPGPLGELGIVVPQGRNLGETLLLNTPLVPQGLEPEDRPQWEIERTAEWNTRPAIGLLDLYTWQSRRIRLQPERREGRVVIRQALVSAGDRLTPLPIDLENHTAWQPVANPKGGQAPRRPIRHQPGKSAWRGLESLLATQSSTNLLEQCRRLADDDVLDPAYPLQVATAGVVYGNQRAVVEDLIHDLIPLPVLALLPDSQARRAVLEVVQTAEALRVAANRLDDDLRRSQGADPTPWDKGTRLGEPLIAELDPLVRRFLAGAQAHPEQLELGLEAWRVAARRCALKVIVPALDATPDTAILGRYSNNYWNRLAGAEASYRRAVNKALPTQGNGEPQ